MQGTWKLCCIFLTLRSIQNYLKTKAVKIQMAPRQRRAKLDVGREVMVREMTNTYTVLRIHQTCSKVLPVVQLIDSSQPHKVGATLPLHFTDEDLEHREVK